jgi:ABC-type hemin transport system substrate-binding protein
MEEVVAKKPEVIVLPDEPHAFSAEDEMTFREAMPDAAILRVSGKDLFWYGAWTIDALDRLASQLLH